MSFVSCLNSEDENGLCSGKGKIMSEYLLKYGKAQAKVNSIGGELVSYVAANGKEYIWGGDPAVWSGHAPVLFPVIGTTIDGKVKIGGDTYEIPKHGLVRKLEFQLGKHGEDFVEYTISPDANMKKQYPFDFTLHVAHSITETGFKTVFLAENRSDRAMPFCVGGHPAFVCPLNSGETFEDYILKFERPEHVATQILSSQGVITGQELLPEFTDTDTLKMHHRYFDERDTLIFDNLKSRSVKLVNAKTGKGIRFSFRKSDCLAIWSAPGKNADYVCLEPWCGLPAVQGESGNLEDKPHARVLEPGMSFRMGYAMDVID